MARAWGIDIGRGAVKGVLLRKTGRGLELLKADMEPVESRPGATDSQSDEAARAALSAFLKRNGTKGEKVFVSVPGHTAFNRLLRIPPVEAKKLASSIRFEAQQQIPFPIDEVIWDYHQLQRDASSGEDWEVNLFAVKKDFIEKALLNLGLAGLDVDGIQVSPLALFNFMRYDLNLRGTNVLMDMGADSTDLILLDSDKTWIRNIPIAGSHITKQLEEKFKIPFAEAEKLKLKSTGTMQAQKIFKVMKPTLSEMSAEISRSIGYYASQVPDVKFKDAYITGNSSQLVGLRRFLAESLELDVKGMERFQRISIAPGASSETLNENFPAFAVALGLAIQGLGEADVCINLIPAPVRAAREEKRRRPWLLASAAVLVVMLLTVFMSKGAFRDEYAAAMGAGGKARDRYESMDAKLRKLVKAEDVIASMQARADLSRNRGAVLKIYDDILGLLERKSGAAGQEGPELWLLKVEIGPKPLKEGERETRALAVSVLAAMPDPMPELTSMEELRNLSREKVKEFVIARIASMDRRYANVEQDLEKFVPDLNASLTPEPGRKYYRFRVKWDVALEGN